MINVVYKHRIPASSGRMRGKQLLTENQPGVIW